MSGVLQELEQAIQAARDAANEIKQEKLKERVVNLETKYRDLEGRLAPLLNLLERR